MREIGNLISLLKIDEKIKDIDLTLKKKRKIKKTESNDEKEIKLKIKSIKSVEEVVKEKTKKKENIEESTEDNQIIKLLKDLTKIAYQNVESITSSYNSLNERYNIHRIKEGISYSQVTSQNYIYEGINATGIFIPKLQLAYVSDAKDLNKVNGMILSSVTAVSHRDTHEVQRTSKMNGLQNNNHMDPEIKERYKIWSWFSFNFTKSIIMYDNIGA